MKNAAVLRKSLTKTTAQLAGHRRRRVHRIPRRRSEGRTEAISVAARTSASPTRAERAPPADLEAESAENAAVDAKVYSLKPPTSVLMLTTAAAPSWPRPRVDQRGMSVDDGPVARHGPTRRV